MTRYFRRTMHDLKIWIELFAESDDPGHRTVLGAGRFHSRYAPQGEEGEVVNIGRPNQVEIDRTTFESARRRGWQ